MDEIEQLIPRKIWLLWYQGVSEAPFIVRKCIESWKKENPTWDVIVLDSGNLNKYVNLDLPENIIENLSQNHRANLIRLLLLIKYGGIWADATTFCTKPLDEWIDEHSESGLFVFHKPGRDRIMSNWFIAAEKECPLIVKLYKRHRLYWIQNNFNNKPNRVQRKVKVELSKFLNRSDSTTKYWFNPIVTKLLKIYPYFVFHYMFERLVSTDDESKAIWRNTKRVSAELPLLIQTIGLFSQPSPSIKRKIKDNDIPMFKLSWKFDESRYSSDTLLYYLIERLNGHDA